MTKYMMTEAKKRRSKKRPYSSMSITTGDIGYNISRFNQAMGTAGVGSAGHSCCGDSSGGCATGGLTEAKRYVRRYYIRPQNIFCSNKAEILKTLIELDDTNCSIYTLNNLGDEKDVSKLMNSDIIYYYDDGILYDKNKVKVMDYDLSIKHEEERKHFANVDKTSDKEFKAEYEDRMTDVTELEEATNFDLSTGADLATEAFNLDFDDYNVFGENLTESRHNTCCICGEALGGLGNNPEPFRQEGRCCEGCNTKFVIPAKLANAVEV